MRRKYQHPDNQAMVIDAGKPVPESKYRKYWYSFKSARAIALVFVVAIATPQVSFADGPNGYNCSGKPCKLMDYLELLRPLSIRFSPFNWPTIPVDQIFACGVYYPNTNQYSPLWHYLNFQQNGTVELAIETNAGNWINGSGNYNALQNLGLLGYEINLNYTIANQNYQTHFKLANLQKSYALNMIRYFDASGEYTENGVTSPIEMYCQAYGHRYNTAAHNAPLSFRCPDQVTAGGVYENVFRLNENAPGNVFRQRDFYPTGSSNQIIERSDVGIFRRTGNDITMDFETNPSISTLQMFSDHNEIHAEILSNGGQLQLFVQEFPQGLQHCNQIP